MFKKKNILTPYLSAFDFRILDFGVYFKLGKKSSSKPTWFFFEFELDFYCLCSLQKSISKSNWFFSFLNLIFWNWKKFEWHSISQKSSGDRVSCQLISKCPLKYQFWKNVTSEKWNSDGLNTFTTYLSSLLGVIAIVFSRFMTISRDMLDMIKIHKLEQVRPDLKTCLRY